jgi:large subunit ribosomal protein L24
MEKTSVTMKVHNGDTVLVLRGKDKGVRGKVISVDHEKNVVTVEGVNKVYKHVKPSQKNPQGGRLHKEMPIPASSVMVLCPKTNQPTRIGYRYLNDGSKERYAKKSGASMNIVSPPKKAYAKKS